VNARDVMRNLCKGELQKMYKLFHYTNYKALDGIYPEFRKYDSLKT